METNHNFFVVIFFISTLPITIGQFSVLLPDMPYLLFPTTGLLLTVFFWFFCLSEASRINSIDKRIKKIIGDYFPDDYVKSSLESLIEKPGLAIKMFNWRMAKWVPTALSIMQILIAGIMICLYTAIDWPRKN